MTLREITIDNSDRYIKNVEQTREVKPIMMKNKKQNEQNEQPFSGGGKPNISQNNKKQ